MAEIWTEEEWQLAERRDPTKIYVEIEKNNKAGIVAGLACFVSMVILVPLWGVYNLSERGWDHLIRMWGG